MGGPEHFNSSDNSKESSVREVNLDESDLSNIKPEYRDQIKNAQWYKSDMHGICYDKGGIDDDSADDGALKFTSLFKGGIIEYKFFVKAGLDWNVIGTVEKLPVLSDGDGGADDGERQRLENEFPENPEELMEANDSKLANENVTSKFPKFNKIDSISRFETGVDKEEIKSVLKGQWWRPEGYRSHFFFSRSGMDTSKPEDGDFRVTVIPQIDDDSYGLTIRQAKNGRWQDAAELLVTK